MKKKTIKKVMQLIVESGAMYDVTTCKFDKAAKKINKFLKHIEQQQEDEEQETEQNEEWQPKYKIGDVVEVLEARDSHNYENGDIVKIVEFDILRNYRCIRLSDYYCQFLCDNDIKGLHTPTTETPTERTFEEWKQVFPIGSKVNIKTEELCCFNEKPKETLTVKSYSGTKIVCIGDGINWYLSPKSIEPYTKQTEQKQPSFEWKDCFTGKGYWSDVHSKIKPALILSDNYNHINVASNEQIVEQFHAACQLSHIIPKINEYVKDVLKEKEETRYIGLFGYGKEIITYQSYKGNLLPLYNKTAFKILLQTNQPLIKQYFGL